MTTLSPAKAPSVAEVDGFIDLLRAACESRAINSALERLLSQPDEHRKALVHAWVSDMLVQDVPRDFIHAIACLQDDGVAEKAYEVIYQCRRKSPLAWAFGRLGAP